jgi:hypothetical protein
MIHFSSQDSFFITTYLIYSILSLFMNINCLKCKGSDPINACGRAFCPLIAKSEAIFKVQKFIDKKDFQASSPSPFIGRFGYPDINIGILSPPEIKENAWEYDAPKFWSAHNYSIQQVIELRSELINSSKKSSIRSREKMLEIAQEIGMASKPVDVEISLEDKPKFRLNTDSYMAPHGPNAKLKNAEITANPKIDSKVDKVVSDTDLKANDALIYLYEHGFDENFLSKILSVGTLGIAANRKLVPTRWSITASDDMLGKHLIKEIKDFPTADYQAYFGSYLGNYYLILFFPDVWSYELFETYMPQVSWNQTDDIQFTTDFEPYQGRKYYSEACAGGYYTVRLAIAEHLKKIRKQASVLAIRIITGEYAAPLGVWVTREATRKSMASKPIDFSSKELMLNYATSFVKTKFGYSIDNILRESKLLKNLSQQKKLTHFL